MRLESKTRPYTRRMAGRPKDDPNRPKQGAHLLALRLAAGLTQTQLAEFVGVPQGTIALWEQSEKPPRSDALPRMATALGVSVDELLIATASSPPPLARKPGPVSKIQQTFEEVRQLPRHQQRKILETVQALVDQYKRQTS
jgi:transcriptional regulator with XRE-family HTH domain